MSNADEKQLYLGPAEVRAAGPGGTGDWVEREGTRYYRISGYHTMPPFLVSVVSGHDHWLFVSSTGGMTCGRRAPENALFPYGTDDKVHDSCETTGPVTALQVTQGGKTCLWRPFASGPRVNAVERNLYKNVTGSELVFEERNHDLGLSFSYTWTTSNRFGFVRRSRLENLGDDPVEVELLDGIRNIMPAGVDRGAQSELSTLVDAYKESEVVQDACAAIYSLSSILTDRAEPNEALRATVVWSTGLEGARVRVSADALRDFCAGRTVADQPRLLGRRGAFLLQATVELPAGGCRDWRLVADLEHGPSSAADLIAALRSGISAEEIDADVAEGVARLESLVGHADGFQSSADGLTAARHFSNTLFNIMRGGVFPHGYTFPHEDFLGFIDEWNRPLRECVQSSLDQLDGDMSLSAAQEWAEASGSIDLVRLVHEYLPLTFSRRHGDPSRPWNHFNIELEGPDGEERLAYQGNWRDIFQNWEALALSFPEYVESFITKFLNASTRDGFNPYRITRNGVDWEAPEPDNPWSNIGYWGDHQVGYLLRLLELSRAYHPGRLGEWLDRRMFVSADVPYRIRPYASLLRDPRDSVEFDFEHDRVVKQRAAELGADGRLVTLPDGTLHRVSLLEKLLLLCLVRMGSLVPGGGIWMNTQRPEWNDANNALVGYGLSMVTLYYLRGFVSFLGGLVEAHEGATFTVTRGLGAYHDGILTVLREHEGLLAAPPTEGGRKEFMDDMGAVNDHHRERVYAGASGEEVQLEVATVRELLELASRYLDHSIDQARREDGLFHSYNLLRLDAAGHGVEHLDEMLEGQVATLSSGFLEAEDALGLLKALRGSRLYRPDQNSYVLYPVKELPRFLEKNMIPEELVAGSEWIQRELEAGRKTYVERDASGRVHFHPDFRNGVVLHDALERDPAVGSEDSRQLCEIYEAVFSHHAFTGRSGSMYKYEGLGCIYWHMVSKLALSTSETADRARAAGASQEVLASLAERFRDIKDGIGVHKTPAQYGAFPTDPYSHTPGFIGVQQPGLTGQVKEDVIARFSELGVRVEGGELSFQPCLLRRDELLEEPMSWRYSTGGALHEEQLPAGSLGFTLCGIPVIYSLGSSRSIELLEQDGSTTKVDGARLDAEVSRAIFQRSGRITRIAVELPGESFC